MSWRKRVQEWPSFKVGSGRTLKYVPRVKRGCNVLLLRLTHTLYSNTGCTSRLLASHSLGVRLMTVRLDSAEEERKEDQESEEEVVWSKIGAQPGLCTQQLRSKITLLSMVFTNSNNSRQH